MSQDISLSNFIGMCSAYPNNNNTWTVEITLKDLTKSKLIVENCFSEYDAKERVYLFLINAINNNR